MPAAAASLSPRAAALSAALCAPASAASDSGPCTPALRLLALGDLAGARAASLALLHAPGRAWRDAPPLARRVLGAAACSAAAAALDAGGGAGDAVLRLLDEALLFCAPGTPEHDLALALAARVTAGAADSVAADAGALAPLPLLSSPGILSPPLHLVRGAAASRPVPRLRLPSVMTFRQRHFAPRLPVVLEGCVAHWPALDRWSDARSLLRAAGTRTVPVELGASSTAADWSQRLMTLRQFLTEHVLAATSHGGSTAVEKAGVARIGYLAQHRLFDQVPQLLADVSVPDYCALADDADGCSEPQLMCWLGPADTVSSLHFDRPHNLLAQVVGFKRVILFAPDEAPRLRPGAGEAANTAAADPELADGEAGAVSAGASSLECVLAPGDALYIPPLWWHQVRALSVSASVSCWW